MLMNLLSGRFSLHFVGGEEGGTHYNVGLGLTVHDQSSSTELFYIQKAIGARARAPRGGGGVHGRAGEVDWH